MKQAQFEQIIEGQIEMIRNTMLTKQKEYATEDRLHNFRTVAGLRDCTMEQALGGMLAKHTVSIYDMIESGREYSIPQWDEKINDHIVYLLLLKAIVEERHTLESAKHPAGPTMSDIRRHNQAMFECICHPIPEPPTIDLSGKVPVMHDYSQTKLPLTPDEVRLAFEIKQLIVEYEEKGMVSK